MVHMSLQPYMLLCVIYGVTYMALLGTNIWYRYIPDSILNDVFYIKYVSLRGTFVSIETTYFLCDDSLQIIWHPVSWRRIRRLILLSNRCMYSFLSALLLYCQFVRSLAPLLLHMMSFEIAFITGFIKESKTLLCLCYFVWNAWLSGFIMVGYLFF